jgi:hypothetical protein
MPSGGLPATRDVSANSDADADADADAVRADEADQRSHSERMRASVGASPGSDAVRATDRRASKRRGARRSANRCRP